MTMIQISATLDAVKILRDTRMALYTEHGPNAVTRILMDAEDRLNADAKIALVGESR